MSTNTTLLLEMRTTAGNSSEVRQLAENGHIAYELVAIYPAVAAS